MIPVTNGNGGASHSTLNVLQTFTYVNKGLAKIIRIQLQLQIEHIAYYISAPLCFFALGLIYVVTNLGYSVIYSGTPHHQCELTKRYCGP